MNRKSLEESMESMQMAFSMLELASTIQAFFSEAGEPGIHFANPYPSPPSPSSENGTSQERDR